LVAKLAGPMPVVGSTRSAELMATIRVVILRNIRLIET
jgi:hypothetical protein